MKRGGRAALRASALARVPSPREEIDGKELNDAVVTVGLVVTAGCSAVDKVVLLRAAADWLRAILRGGETHSACDLEEQLPRCAVESDSRTNTCEFDALRCRR